MESMASKNATFSPGSLELLDNDPFLSCYTPFELFNPFWAGPPGQKCVILHAHIESLWITFPEQKWLRESFNRASKKHVTLHSPGGSESERDGQRDRDQNPEDSKCFNIYVIQYVFSDGFFYCMNEYRDRGPFMA